MTKDKLTAIILVGGKSSRMGQDKSLLPINGIPLLLGVYQVAAACANRVYFITPWQERYQDLLPENSIFIREDLLLGETQGPLVAFSQGLAQVETEWVLLLACDLPKLKIEIVQAWAEKLVDVRKDAIAFLAHHPKGWEPLCGFYHRSSLPGLNEFINEGGRSFQQWLNQNIVEIIPSNQTSIFFNCNTPEDLANSAE
ncbi:molybdenum cofactor guanylyltransferase [Brunnivagina elsteri]|uniref:Probable molybdenum cofactor guanylyltransferase n=1 Tax=Brunnivagina elsteri CCALA 953 TaxID=987040 RepID=A0A2A2TNK6_9CYAN|nr:molybdenum cofactor guanylyltransferase [Calothrix elsteri]PAX60005.1 molybdenum cofactor guanylyltransferase [Calothrix elsteri CCALA 953]